MNKFEYIDKQAKQLALQLKVLEVEKIKIYLELSYEKGVSDGMSRAYEQVKDFI